MAQDQRVEFLFAAQVTGQNELQRLTQAVDKLRQETEQLKGANAGLAASTDAVIRNGTRYNNALDAQSKALRNTRQGTQQLGMQINDFATSVSTGASPIQAFNQQIGQVGYALSMMEGRLGAVGTFLAGPWGAAITLATAFLVPMIAAIFQTSEASKELGEVEKAGREATINLLEAKAELDKALGKNTQSYQEARQAALASALADLESAATAVKASQIRVGAALQERRVVRSIQESEGGGIGGMLLQAFGYGNVDKAVVEAKKATNSLNNAAASVLKAKASLANATRGGGAGGSSRRDVGGGGAAPRQKEKEDQIEINKGLAEYTNLLNSGLPPLTAYQQGVYALQKAYGALSPELQRVYAEQQRMALLQQDMAQIARDDAKIAKLLEEGGGVLPQIAEQAYKPTEAMDAIIARGEQLRASFEGIGQTVSDAFQGMLTGAMSFKDGMKGIISSVINELWKLFVVQQIVGFVSGGISSITGIKLPGKAIGGSVGKNQPYMVGERGPELFIPGGSGTIIPNRNLGGGKGGNAISINVDARGSADPAAVRAQVQQGILEAAPAIIAAAEARTVNGLRRPRLGGVMQ